MDRDDQCKPSANPDSIGAKPPFGIEFTLIFIYDNPVRLDEYLGREASSGWIVNLKANLEFQLLAIASS
jgi:hypothetical protein